ncbi:Dymeclin [Camellia lanceoleosa]|uniref:Dymeclin n=1 Tax=Camellia lanceoleosa TaxID=1840588 RepID=A0ACC0GD91_9ERIC|nr:Dymeclin [Camellia lanceoleosa]
MALLDSSSRPHLHRRHQRSQLGLTTVANRSQRRSSSANQSQRRNSSIILESSCPLKLLGNLENLGFIVQLESCPSKLWYLADETAILLLYSLVHGNSVLRLMPILETLYNASKETSNQIYMVLIILLVLSQDSSFNASIHKLMLPTPAASNFSWFLDDHNSEKCSMLCWFLVLEGLVISKVLGNLCLVFEYMEHDLAGLIASPTIKFSEPQSRGSTRDGTGVHDSIVN